MTAKEQAGQVVEALKKRSYAIEMQADTTGTWYPNGIRLATFAEADAYGNHKFCAWSAATAYRVVESPDPVNYRWTGDGLVKVGN